MDKILAEISAGELIDKITILEIKKEKIKEKEKLVEVEKELKSLNLTKEKFIANNNSISDYKNKLKDINIKLWDVENGKRAAEKKRQQCSNQNVVDEDDENEDGQDLTEVDVQKKGVEVGQSKGRKIL